MEELTLQPKTIKGRKRKIEKPHDVDETLEQVKTTESITVVETPNNITEEYPTQNNITMTIIDDTTTPTAKKRGRKPKGGKLISKKQEKMTEMVTPVNIILHLKCSMQDLNEHNTELNRLVTDPLNYNPIIPPTILTYNNTEKSQAFSIYDDVNNISAKDIAYDDGNKPNSTTNNICKSCSSKLTQEEETEINMKDINSKLKALKIKLYKNNLQDKKSACFWCTYEYDNPTCYIPKHDSDHVIYGYGSFCRPECAVAFLMNESIDDSTKFERYQLLNQVYGKVYDYTKNIKPAPDPHYLLEKFYGTLSIQEYRKLLKTESMFIVIDKPMSRVLPELHEDNEDILSNVFGNKPTSGSHTTAKQTGMYKVKRESEKQKGPTKNSIMKERFGITA
jgi:hypothetical protein